MREKNQQLEFCRFAKSKKSFCPGNSDTYKFPDAMMLYFTLFKVLSIFPESAIDIAIDLL